MAETFSEDLALSSSRRQPLKNLVNSRQDMVLAFAIRFLPSFLGGKLLARQLGGKTRRHAMLGPVDRVLGGGFGALKGLLGATLFFLLANLATDMVYGPQADRPQWMTRSRTFPLLNASGRSIVDWVEARRLHANKVGEGA